MTGNRTPGRRWTVYQPDYRCPHCGSDDIGPVLRASDEPAAYWCPNCAREIPEAPQVEVIPVAPLLRWLDEQAKAAMDKYRNFRSSYDEGRFDAFGVVEAHLGATELEPDECDYCRAFRFRDWDTVGRLQEERGGPDKACRCDSWERNYD